ncbi:MAG: tetratricopeptide repeat protein, partial [Acidobacteriia bacterium]|nr:tetratricopeptide repeat protein [Terriglobia bacterium]MBV9264767.1 tetratricopeptide repeat protein [Acidobacteriaceae bacterium]
MLLFFAFLLLLFTADGNQASALLHSGLEALQQGNPQQARADLERASKLDPQNAYVWSSLAEAYRRVNEPKLASDAAAAAEKSGGSDPIVCHALALFYAQTGQFAHAAALEETFANTKGGPPALDRA